jgi:hypothetical protein
MPSMPRSEGSSVDPGLDADALHRVDALHPAGDDHEIGRAHLRLTDRFGPLTADVDAHLGQGPDRQLVEFRPWLRAGGVNFHRVAGDRLHESGSHLGFARVLHTDEQHSGPGAHEAAPVPELRSSASSPRTRASMSSTMRRTVSTSWPAGSSTGQSS